MTNRIPGDERWRELSELLTRIETMNRPLTPSLSPSDEERVAGGRERGGSWLRCAAARPWRLSMNPLTPSPLPHWAKGGQVHGKFSRPHNRVSGPLTVGRDSVEP